MRLNLFDVPPTMPSSSIELIVSVWLVTGIEGVYEDYWQRAGTKREHLFPIYPLKFMQLQPKKVDRDKDLCYNYTIAGREIVPLNVI